MTYEEQLEIQILLWKMNAYRAEVITRLAVHGDLPTARGMLNAIQSGDVYLAMQLNISALVEIENDQRRKDQST
jgi:hypothetical protein